VLAKMAVADRDYPPVARSIRDGFAVRAADLPGRLRVVGEVAAGGAFVGTVGDGECVEIMTGAPMPDGADSVVMVEHTRREGDHMLADRRPTPGEFVNPRGAEARRGMALMPGGRRIGFADVALLATVGLVSVEVFRRPRVAILSTGDEVVPVERMPEPNQVRNSNAHALAVQVARAGGVPTILPIAPDNIADTTRLVGEGLRHDLLLLSGGVSAGKYDYVERVLADHGAEFYFDRVLIQPGQPLVFGRARDRFFFGLPGNPASTMVTFELFGRAAVGILAGEGETPLHMPFARLAHEFSHKPGLTRFLPARLSDDGAEVTAIRWQGSSDVAALARSNAFLVVDAARESWAPGDLIRVLPK
jgi:molybdopterin molybdotransferase